MGCRAFIMYGIAQGSHNSTLSISWQSSEKLGIQTRPHPLKELILIGIIRYLQKIASAGREGIEPSYWDSKSHVLPLDDLPIFIFQKRSISSIFYQKLISNIFLLLWHSLDYHVLLYKSFLKARIFSCKSVFESYVRQVFFCSH